MKCCVCHRKLGKKAIKLYDTPDSEVWVCGVKCLRVYNQEDEEDEEMGGRNAGVPVSGGN